MKKLSVFILTALFLAQSACSTLTKTEGSKTLVLKTVSGEQEFRVEVAKTEEELRTGLMRREFLPEKSGMLFVFTKPSRITMWMKNTLIPLDMIFFDEAKIVVDILPKVPPCQQEPCPTYAASKKALYVLELNAGEAAKFGINLGDNYEFKD